MTWARKRTEHEENDASGPKGLMGPKGPPKAMGPKPPPWDTMGAPLGPQDGNPPLSLVACFFSSYFFLMRCSNDPGTEMDRTAREESCQRFCTSGLLGPGPWVRMCGAERPVRDVGLGQGQTSRRPQAWRGVPWDSLRVPAEVDALGAEPPERGSKNKPGKPFGRPGRPLWTVCPGPDFETRPGLEG